MKHTRAPDRLVATLAAICCTALLSCGDSGPTMPEEPKDYVVYYRDGGINGLCYGYHFATGRLDSFPPPYDVYWGMTASADGSLLYLRGQEGVGVVSTESLELVGTLGRRGGRGIQCSPDGRFLAIYYSSSLLFLDANDYSVYDSVNTTASGGIFTQDGSRYYYCEPSTGSVRVLDMERREEIARHTFEYRPHMVRPTPDETRWILYSRFDYDVSMFYVYDVTLDSIIFSQTVWPGWGVIQVTPDGRYACFSIPGPLQEGVAPPDHFYIFDIAQNRMARLVNTVGIKDGRNPYYMPIGTLVMSPDGRWLMAADGDYGHQFLIYDMEKMEVARYVETGDVWPIFFTCQSGR